MTDIKTSVLFVSGKPAIVTLDYMITVGQPLHNEDSDSANEGSNYFPLAGKRVSEFRLSYYPHRLDVFRDMLDSAFQHKAKHTIYGDFKPLSEIEDPAFYIHVMEKRV